MSPFSRQLVSSVLLLASLAGCQAPPTAVKARPSSDAALTKLGDCRLFAAAWRRATADGALAPARGARPRTFFAPCDAALEARRSSLERPGPEGRAACLALIRSHTADGRLALAELLACAAITTLDGRRHSVLPGPSTIRVGAAELLRADQPVKLGVLHTVARPLTAIDTSQRASPTTGAATGAGK